MLTEQKIAEAAPQPEVIASAGQYYIMDRRSNTRHDQSISHEKANNDNSEADAQPLIRKAHKHIGSDRNNIGYILLGLSGATAGAVIAMLFPPDASQTATESIGFLPTLLDRLIKCGGFLILAYVLGYFAAGSMIVWALPLFYSLGAGLIAANSAMTGSPLLIIPYAIYTVVICFASARSAELSSLLLSIVSGKSGSVITDGTAGNSYTMKFSIYLMTISAAAIVEAGITAI